MDVPWHCVELGANEQDSELQEIEAEFWSEMKRAMESGIPPTDEALFISTNTDAHLKLYFSPACKYSFPKLIEKYSATSCIKPMHNEVKIIAGASGAMLLLDEV
jgi:hypothetical protein